MPDDVKMPSDWDDHPGWEAYYAALPTNDFWYNDATTDPGSFAFDRLGSLVDDFLKRDWTTLWFPGCGFSPLPRAFAMWGFTVYATDIALSAIRFQDMNEAIVRPLIAGVKIESPRTEPGSLSAKVQDFRTSFGNDHVDVIFNIKSFQALPPASQAAASKSHFAALRPGGIAFFDTLNVQGTRRDQLEETLVDAGFYVPLQALNKWYRQALAATGIPHMFVLGTPMIPQREDYPHQHGSPEYERDANRLRDLTAEYRARMQAEYDQEQTAVNERTKLAQVIYSTG